MGNGPVGGAGGSVDRGSPFTFLVLRFLNSSSVNSKTVKTSEYEVFILIKNIKIILKKNLINMSYIYRSN